VRGLLAELQSDGGEQQQQQGLFGAVRASHAEAEAEAEGREGVCPCGVWCVAQPFWLGSACVPRDLVESKSGGRPAAGGEGSASASEVVGEDNGIDHYSN
jgi:hypothetical protein